MEYPLYLPRGRARFRTPGCPEEWGASLHTPLHQSITELLEGELISRVLGDPHHRRTLFNVKDISIDGADVAEQVDFRLFRESARSDVDVLVIPAGRPEQSTAIQVKRLAVEVDIDEDGYDKYGEVQRRGPTAKPAATAAERRAEMRKVLARRFGKLVRDGVRQALTKSLGFAQVYLWVFVLVDSRRRNNGWYTYDGADPHLSSVIGQAVSPAGLDPSVGLMRFDWTQAIDRPPFQLGTHSASLERDAILTPQPVYLTDRIRRLRDVSESTQGCVRWSVVRRVDLLG